MADATFFSDKMPVKDENNVNLRTNVYHLIQIGVISKLKVAFRILKDSLNQIQTSDRADFLRRLREFSLSETNGRDTSRPYKQSIIKDGEEEICHIR